MDYYEHRCPVCQKQFDKGSDIVVCPVCGAPHHRECYEQETHCHFSDMHKDGFDYKTEYEAQQKTKNAEEADKSVCHYCGADNEQNSKFCNQCGMPLQERKPYDRHSEESGEHNEGAPYSPPGYGENPQSNTEDIPFGTFAFDPMGGLKPEEEVGDGVTVGEAAKFVKNNTPFYSRLFYQIKKHGRSRFSFVGFIFSGGWMLYRKMYKLGTLITAITALLIITQLFIDTFYSEILNNIALQIYEIQRSSGMFMTTAAMSEIQELISGLDTEYLTVLGIYYLASFGQLALRIICGIFGNRWYYKHCIKKISAIKSSAGCKEAADAELQIKGGVNNALAMSLVITYMVLTLLPYFF